MLIFVLGCGGQHPRPDTFPSEPGSLLSALADHGRELKSLRAELSLEVWRQGERVRISEFLALDQDGRLRFDILTPFGQPMTTVVSDGTRLTVFELENKRFRVGEATAENLATLLPVDLSPKELVMVLRGRAPQIEHRDVRLDWNTQRGWYQIELINEGERQLIEMAPTDLKVRRVRHWRGNVLRYDAHFAEYEGEGHAALPLRMRFEFPGENAQIDIEVVSHEINAELPAETFILKPPRGIRAEQF